ncbi:MAG: hypothetical protein QN178_00890 [Armatimonadota bacterium]|nr:hypothetical protein [Armatimonadota bacterium]
MTRLLAGAVVMALVAVGLTVGGWWPHRFLETAGREPVAIVLGRSRIAVPRGARVGVQVDRVIRDIAWTGSAWDVRVLPDRVPARPEDVVPYMEGMLVAELMRHADVRVVPLTPGVARLDRRTDTWLGGDAEGRFRFALDPSEIPYRTSRRVGEDMMSIVDTHGFNTLAAPAMHARPFVAIACMDLAASADAALYLASHGINVYGPPDRFGFRLLGYRERRPRAAMILGSAPVRGDGRGGAIIGGQPVEISVRETVIAQYTNRPEAWQYSDAPWRYFSELVERFALDLHVVRVYADAGEIDRVIAEARGRGAKVVAVRVGKSTSMDQAVRDAAVLSAWLSESPSHRAVLFHSALYEPGFQLFKQFPRQTTFGDLDPVIRRGVGL